MLLTNNQALRVLINNNKKQFKIKKTKIFRRKLSQKFHLLFRIFPINLLNKVPVKKIFR
jgi:hypothetical protein